MTLVVVGVGLIGGSFAAAARDSGLGATKHFGRIVGMDNNAAHAQQAKDLGLIDDICTDIPADASAVLLAMPSDQIVDWVVRLADHSGVVFDVGSVKGVMVDAIRQQLGALPANFVPAHPIAGLERSGPTAATADLFRGQRVVVTPVPETDSRCLALVKSWWEATGALVESMQPAEHDVTFATTSHLPHLVAFAYMQQVSSEQLRFAAGGFRDFSRIAAADPDMWTAILQLNAPAIRETLAQLQTNLTALDAALAAGDAASIRRAIEFSQARRRQFDE